MYSHPVNLNMIGAIITDHIIFLTIFYINSNNFLSHFNSSFTSVVSNLGRTWEMGYPYRTNFKSSSVPKQQVNPENF